MLRFLFGDDIFVSYSRRDALRYAEGLAAELADRGFSCRLDQWGSEPGEEMPESLIRGLRWATLLVVVGTPGSAQSPHVEQEIDEFVRTRRPIIPIDVGASVEAARWYPKIQGLALEVEPAADALERGRPSDTVFGRIENSYTYTRRNARIQRTFWGTLAALALLLALGGGLLWMLRRQVDTAEAARAELDARVQVANAELGQAQQDLEQREAEVAEAQSDLAAAQTDLTTARQGLESAEADLGRAEERARRARDDADLQERVAESRRLASLGESLLERDGPRVTALLAVEALGRSATPEAYRVLARALAILPLPERRLELPPEAPAREVVELIPSPDGDLWAGLVRAPDGGVALWSEATGEVLWRPLPWVASIAYGPRGRYLLALGSRITLLDGATATPLPFRVETEGSTDTLRAAFAAGGRTLALARRPGVVELLRLPAGDVEATLPLPGGEGADPVRGLAFSPDGRFLLVGWRDRVFAWTGPDWATPREWRLDGGFREMAVDPRSELVLVATGGSLELLRLGRSDEKAADDASAPAEPLRAMRVLDRGAQAPRFSGDGSVFAAREERGGRARVWSREVEALATSLPTGGVTDLDLGPDGRYLALARADQSYLWDVGRDELASRFPYGRRVRFAPRGERVASIGPGAELHLWQPQVAWPLAGLEVPEGSRLDPAQVRFSRSGEHLVVARRHAAHVWTPAAAAVRSIEVEDANAVTVSPDGRFIAVDVGEATRVHDVAEPSSIVRLAAPEPLDWHAIHERDLQKGSRRAVLTLLEPAERRGSTRTIAISPRSSFVATLRADDLVRVWESATGREVRSWPFAWFPSAGLVGTAFRAAFSADERRLAVVTESRVAVFDLESGEALPPIDAGTRRVDDLALSPDGSRLALTDRRTLSIYDLATPGPPREIPGGAIAEEVLFSPPGRLALAPGETPPADSSDASVALARRHFRPRAVALARLGRQGPELVDLARPSAIRRFPSEATVTDVAVTPDGRFLAAATALDVRVYDAGSGTELARIPGGGRDQELHFTPAGDLLAVRSGDRVAVYAWRREALVDEACRRVVANLTCAEWQRYVGDRDCRAVCPELSAPEPLAATSR